MNDARRIAEFNDEFGHIEGAKHSNLQTDLQQYWHNSTHTADNFSFAEAANVQQEPPTVRCSVGSRQSTI